MARSMWLHCDAPDVQNVLLEAANQHQSLGGQVSHRPDHPGCVREEEDPWEGASPLEGQVDNLHVGRDQLLRPLY